MRHRIRFQQLIKGQDAAGGRTETWSDYADAFAEIRPVSGGERWYAHEKHATATHQILTRYIPGLDPKMRIAARDRTFEIVSILNLDERDRALRIIAREEADT